MRALITVGAGFIGSHLVEALTARGERVRVFDNFSTGLRSNLETIRPAPEIIEADLANAGALEKVTAGVSTVYHLGALASVQRSVENGAVGQVDEPQPGQHLPESDEPLALEHTEARGDFGGVDQA